MERELTHTQLLTGQHILRNSPLSLSVVVKCINDQHRAQLSDQQPVLLSLTSHETPKTRIDLWRKSGMHLKQDFTVGSYHLTIIQPKQDKITPYLDMVQDDRLTHNSTMENCFTRRSPSFEALQMHTQSDFLTPETSRFSVAFQENACSLPFLCRQRTRKLLWTLCQKTINNSCCY